jgi:thiamine pyrophosphate-dependent acetolactate synthase large subunit-like protein
MLSVVVNSAMAEAVGVRGVRIEDPGRLEEGIAAALAHVGIAASSRGFRADEV